MRQFLTLLLISGNLVATAGQEGTPFIATIWQAADGSYRFQEFDGDVNGVVHVFGFENPTHAPDCPCKD